MRKPIPNPLFAELSLKTRILDSLWKIEANLLGGVLMETEKVFFPLRFCECGVEEGAMPGHYLRQGKDGDFYWECTCCGHSYPAKPEDIPDRS